MTTFRLLTALSILLFSVPVLAAQTEEVACEASIEDGEDDLEVVTYEQTDLQQELDDGFGDFGAVVFVGLGFSGRYEADVVHHTPAYQVGIGGAASGGSVNLTLAFDQPRALDLGVDFRLNILPDSTITPFVGFGMSLIWLTAKTAPEEGVGIGTSLLLGAQGMWDSTVISVMYQPEILSQPSSEEDETLDPYGFRHSIMLQAGWRF